MKIDNLFNFSALATSDLFVCLTCIPRGIRFAMKVTYFRPYPIVEFFNQFSYTSSIFLTVTMIVHRYLVFTRHIKGSKGEQGFSRIKWIITVVVFAALTYSIPTMFEYTWETKDGVPEVVRSQIFKDNEYFFKIVYKAWMGFTFRFLLPTICLMVFSVLLIREVCLLNSKYVLRLLLKQAISYKIQAT